MPAEHQVLLSAFADEGNGVRDRKSVIEQLAVIAAVGLKYYSPRFTDVDGSGVVKHVVDLSDAEYEQLNRWHREFGVGVTSIGARVGKVKLCDVDDGTHNKFIPFEEYLRTEVQKTIQAALALNTKLVRGFSFYHPQGTSPHKHLDQAAEQIGQIVEACAANGLVYGLEIEPNLVGETGPLLAELAMRVNHPNMVLIFDGGNIAAQGKNPIRVYEEYTAMRDELGWMHIKDYANQTGDTWTGEPDGQPINEEKLKNFVPANVGDSGHELVLRNLRQHLPALTERMQSLGVPGFFLEVEPHLKGGGQFGGFSGPDGMGVAVRSLTSLLDYVGVGYELRTFDDIRALRGF